MSNRNFPSTGTSLVQRPELASGIRLDGRFEGPKTDTSSIWKGRPPTLPDGTPYPSLVLSASRGNGVAPASGSTVTIQAEGAAGNGGRNFREFQIGGGLTAEIMAGYYDHVLIRAVTPIPSGMNLYFVWSLQVFSSAKLWRFVDYPVAGVDIDLPEGVDQITFEDVGLVTFNVPQFGSTFSMAVTAGQTIPVVWSSMSFSVPTKLIFRLKSL